MLTALTSLTPARSNLRKMSLSRPAIQNFHVVGRCNRVLKNVFIGDDEVKNVDLKLLLVAVVEGFHVNIVSASRLEEKGIWHNGSRPCLRFGVPKEKLILANLMKMHHLGYCF